MSADATNAGCVLVIEDDVDVAELIRLNVELAGFDVTIASDGRHGIELAHELQPVAIMLDLRMAPVDGFEVLEALSSDQRTATIPVIVVSVVESRERARDLGARAFVLKPFRPGSLVEVLQETLTPEG